MYKCSLCKDTGKRKNSLGIEVVCECQLKAKAKEECIGSNGIKKGDQEISAPNYKVFGAEVKEATIKSLVPTNRINDFFDVQKLKDNLIKMNHRNAFKAINIEAYVGVLNDIITCIRLGKPLEQSYLIGAPNGFGKTTFADTCIMTLDSQGKKAVPYVSLLDLGDILRQYKLSINNDISKLKHYGGSNDALAEKSSEECKWAYGWNEYMKSDVLFTRLSSVLNKSIESNVLSMVLSERACRGLPTVVFISTSLDPYVKDDWLREHIWDDILAYDNSNALDRLRYISCYKRFVYSKKDGK